MPCCPTVRSGWSLSSDVQNSMQIPTFTHGGTFIGRRESPTGREADLTYMVTKRGEFGPCLMLCHAPDIAGITHQVITFCKLEAATVLGHLRGCGEKTRSFLGTAYGWLVVFTNSKQ